MNTNTKSDFLKSWNRTILESLKIRFDKNNMFESIRGFKNQITESFIIESDWYEKNKKIIDSIKSNNINSILVCGMGGSAIGGEVAKTMLFNNMTVPISINRSNSIPNWVNNNTLVIILSYSGNTYETIDSFFQSIKKTTNIISVSTQLGKINKFSLANDLPIINIPSGLQPRCALGYISSIMILLLVRLNLVEKPKRIKSDLAESIVELKDVDRMNNMIDNPMLLISHQIKDTKPIIYGVENSTSIAAIRFKNQLQENAKMNSFCSDFPEINHNEIESWRNYNNLFFIIWLKDECLDQKSTFLMNKTVDLISDLGIKQESILLNAKGGSNSNKIAKLFKLIYFLDWISYYTALLNSVNPISINNIESVKNSI